MATKNTLTPLLSLLATLLVVQLLWYLDLHPSSWQVATWDLLAFLGISLACFFLWMGNRPRQLAAKTVRHAPPDQLSAIEMAVLYKGSLEANDLAALVTDLANRGHLSLVAHEQQVFFVRQFQPQEKLRSYESLLLDLLAPASSQPGHLQNVLQTLDQRQFSQTIEQIEADIRAALTDRLYFRQNVARTIRDYRLIGALVMAAAAIAIIFAIVSSLTALPAFLLACLGGLVAGYQLASRGDQLTPYSPLGQQVRQQVEDFKYYLTELEHASNEGWQSNLFYQYFPFSLSLGREQPWFAHFANSSFYVPPWYTSTTDDLYSPLDFFMKLQHITDQLSDKFSNGRPS